MPEGTFTNESNMNGLTRATGYRIDQTIIATSGTHECISSILEKTNKQLL